MAYLPTIGVSIDFSNGAGFGIPLQLDDPINGLLDVNVLGDSAAQIVNISTGVAKISIKRGRDLFQDQFTTGTASVRILDPNGYWNPQNAISPYYPNLVPLRKLRIYATYLGVKTYLFSGYTQTYTYTYPIGQQTGYVDIGCSDAFRLFAMSNVVAVAGAVDGQDTGARINSILDAISWPPSMRSIDTGATLCQADPATTRTALQALKNAEFCEFGAFYIDTQGNAIFVNRANVYAKQPAAGTVFNQSGGIPYANVVMAFDDKLILNDLSIQRNGGTAQVASDATSIAAYFAHSYHQASLVLQADADALNIALAYVESRKDTTIRFDAMTLNLAATISQAATTAAVMALDYFSPVTISNVTPQGSNVTKNLQIHAVDHEITPLTWETTYTTSESIIDGFILDSTLYGVLDVSTLAY
jgi:hypothetical protein